MTMPFRNGQIALDRTGKPLPSSVMKKVFLSSDWVLMLTGASVLYLILELPRFYVAFRNRARRNAIRENRCLYVQGADGIVRGPFRADENLPLPGDGNANGDGDAEAFEAIPEEAMNVDNVADVHSGPPSLAGSAQAQAVH